MLNPAIRRTLTAITASVLCLSSCDMLRRGVGKGSADLPRVEVEVAVTTDASFAGSLANVDPALGQRVAERVLSQADVGLRFYAVPTSRYGSGQARPEYLMTVKLTDLAMTPEQQLTKTKLGDTETTVLQRWVSKVNCSASTTLERRRAGAPALLISRGVGKGVSSGSRPKQGTTVPNPLTVRETGGDENNPLVVGQTRLLDAVADAYKNSLREMTVSIDRELKQRFAPVKDDNKRSATRPATPDTTPPPYDAMQEGATEEPAQPALPTPATEQPTSPPTAPRRRYEGEVEDAAVTKPPVPSEPQPGAPNAGIRPRQNPSSRPIRRFE